MTGNMTVLDALRPPATAGAILRTVPGPQGITSDVIEGRAGIFRHHGRRLIYLARARSVTWWEWQAHQPEFSFPEPGPNPAAEPPA